MTLEFGYLEDIDAVAGKMRDDLRMMVFSATIPQMLRPFLKKYMKSPVLVEIDDDKVTTENVEHILIATKHKNRYEVLKKIIESIDPYVCIIFANTRSDVASTTKKLREDGFKVGEIHGDLEPRERKQMMRRIQNNEYQFIVELILMEYRMLLIWNFLKNRIFIFIVVVVAAVEIILEYVTACMIQPMKQI